MHSQAGGELLLVAGRRSMLQRVKHRMPAGQCVTHESGGPAYLVFHWVEDLACGHQHIAYPQSDPGIAVRRNCLDCDNGLKKVPRRPPKNLIVMPMPDRKKAG
jgi:hypothetical protein